MNNLFSELLGGSSCLLPQAFSTIKPHQRIQFDFFLQETIEIKLCQYAHIHRYVFSFVQGLYLTFSDLTNFFFMFLAHRKCFRLLHTSSQKTCCSCRFPNLSALYIFLQQFKFSNISLMPLQKSFNQMKPQTKQIMFC